MLKEITEFVEEFNKSDKSLEEFMEDNEFLLEMIVKAQKQASEEKIKNESTNDVVILKKLVEDELKNLDDTQEKADKIRDNVYAFLNTIPNDYKYKFKVWLDDGEIRLLTAGDEYYGFFYLIVFSDVRWDLTEYYEDDWIGDDGSDFGNGHPDWHLTVERFEDEIGEYEWQHSTHG